MTKLKIIVNCGPCEKFVGKCLASIKAQTYQDWEAYVTADPCGDDTFSHALLAAGADSRIHVKQNRIRHYSLYNLVKAIQRSRAEPEDVIVTLDGDDWFATKDALRTIADTYEQFDCWMTYGSWLSNVVGPGGRRDGMWPAYPEETTDFRRSRWLGTAVRTWKKWLWDQLHDSDLRNASRRYFRASEDQAIMLPLLEMCGTPRARHIAAPLMIYNKKAIYPIDTAITEEKAKNGDLLDRRKPYRRLENKPHQVVRAGMETWSRSC